MAQPIFAPCELGYTITVSTRHLDIGEVRDGHRSTGYTVKGYRVTALIAPPSSDDLWEGVSHKVTWLTREAAEAFVARVKARNGVICLDHWSWAPSQCSPWGWMHTTPAR